MSYPRRSILKKTLNEKLGVTDNSDDFVYYVEQLVKLCMHETYENYFNTKNINFPLLTSNNLNLFNTTQYTDFSKYEFFGVIPKSSHNLSWLSDDNIIFITCNIFDSEIILEQNKNNKFANDHVLSYYLIDNKKMINDNNQYDKNFINYIKRLSKYSNIFNNLNNINNIEFSYNSIASIDIEINFSNYLENGFYCSKKHFNNVDEMSSIIVHELNHVHKRKNLLSNQQLNDYNFIIQQMSSTDSCIKLISNLLYYCNQNEMNAFVEECYKEYLKNIDASSNISKYVKASNTLSTEQRQKFIHNTDIWKKIENLEKQLITNKDDILIYKCRKIYNIFKNSVYNLGILNKEREINDVIKFCKQLYERLLKQIEKMKRKCLRTSTMMESLLESKIFPHGIF